MTRYDLKIGLAALAVVVIVGLLVGYTVGSLTAPRSGVLSAEPGQPPSFDGSARADGGGPTVAGIPGWVDLYVNDYENLLDDAAEARIRAQLTELYDRTGVEMTVLTISDMISYGWSGTFEEFATSLFNAWGIGNATRNDGVLILVSRFDRAMRIELGAGYPRTRDADMKRVIDTAFLPQFREDKYQAGITRGVEETIYEIAGVYPGGYEQGTLERGFSVIARSGAVIPLLMLGAFALFIGIRKGGPTYLRHRPRPCPKCQTLMTRHPGRGSDALSKGQREEERLATAEHDRWACGVCGHEEIATYDLRKPDHDICPECRFRTRVTTRTVVTRPGFVSGGLERHDRVCAHCGATSTGTEELPSTIARHSSSGGGRGGFGGGSSSGGGASGRW